MICSTGQKLSIFSVTDFSDVVLFVHLEYFFILYQYFLLIGCCSAAGTDEISLPSPPINER